MALITQSDVEARLGRSLTAEETTAFTLINSSLQALVERIIGSSVESVSATNRYYDGGVQHLAIDPCTSITSVDQVDDDLASIYTYTSSEYSKEPIHRTTKTMLRHRTGAFATGINNIRVNAKFSINEDTDTLNIIKDTMINALVAEIQNTNNIKRESIEGYSVEFQTVEAKTSLEQIKYLFPGV